jgi:hypothetical protein
MRSRTRVVPGYQLYYRRLAVAVSRSPNAYGICLDLSAFGGVAKAIITIPTHIAMIGRGKQPICSMWANWIPGRSFRPLTDSARSALDIQIVNCSNPSVGPILEQVGDTSTLILDFGNGIATPEHIVIEFSIHNLLIPLPERSPINRAVCGITILWNFKPSSTQVTIIRKPGSITCFTKGNYSLAFPSRPATAGQEIMTTLLYAYGKRVSLLYGFIRDPSTVLLRSASMLILGGLGFIASWLLSRIILADVQAQIASYLGLVVAVTVPTLTAFSELAISDRHSLYSRRHDIGFTLNASAISVGVLGMSVALYLIVRSDFGTKSVPTALGFIPDLLLVIAGCLFTLGASVLVLYRSGLIVPYVCDNTSCQHRLRLRNRRKDCYTTGRVMCKSCFEKTCNACTGNYWERGLAAIDEQHQPDALHCLRGEQI